MSAVEIKQRGRRAHLALVEDVPTLVPHTRKENTYPVNVIAIWGPSGSPGKSTVAANIATELSLSGQKVLLIDLDTLAPSLALGLGLVDTPAGLSACLRLVEQGRFSIDEYHRLTIAIALGRHELRFMPGLSAPHRWPEVSPERFAKLLESVSGLVDLVVVDLAQATQFKSQIFHPSTSMNMDPDRDDLLKEVLLRADKLVMLTGADPIAAQRFMQSQEYLSEVAPNRDQYVVVNRFRTGALGANAKEELEQTFLALTKLRIDGFIPEDRENIDKAMLNGLPLALLKRSSPARQAIADLTKQILISSARGDTLAKLL